MATPVVLHRCPSCSREVSPYDARCPDCRQVLGTDNTCERCHALVPATRDRYRIVCSACDSVRTRRPNTVVVSARELRWTASWERFRAKVYTGAGASSALFGLTCAALIFAYGPRGMYEFAYGLLAFMALVTFAFLSRVKRARTLRDQHDRFSLQQRLLGYAHRQGGVVTAEQIARQLNVSEEAADAMLDELVRVGKADIDVTDKGQIQFSVHAPREALRAGPSSTSVSSARASRRATQTSSR